MKESSYMKKERKKKKDRKEISDGKEELYREKNLDVMIIDKNEKFVDNTMDLHVKNLEKIYDKTNAR